MKLLTSFMIACSFSANVSAAGIDSLKNFVRGTQSARADFEQQVVDKNQRKVSQANGVMQFSRPGKFRWLYEKPYEQVIVGDGVKVWVHDTELNQVTVRKLDQALGSSPAALLAGNNEIERFFNLKNIGARDGLEWLEATPKSKESSFENVRMGFDRQTLKAMELRDNFGQTTVIRFSKLERNPKLAPNQFHFTPPPGADVIGD